MKRQLVALLLSGMLAAPLAQAENTYAGVFYANVESDDIDVKTGNLGITVGSVPDSGGGFEFFYAFTVDEDEITGGGLTADVSTQVLGAFAMYKTPGDYYAKFKAGIAYIDMEVDIDGFGSADDEATNLAYGITLGTRLGFGALELTYLVLPEIDEFEGIGIDAEFDMISLGYNWEF